MPLLRKRLLVTAAAGIALLALPAIGLAQNGDGPPGPPIGTVYGKAPGASEDRAVVAFIEKDGTVTNCGVGFVGRDDEDDLAYVIDVESSGARDGCAEDGDTVSLWFPGVGGDNAAMANQTVEVSGDAGGIEHDVTLSERTNRLVTPGISSNVD